VTMIKLTYVNNAILKLHGVSTLDELVENHESIYTEESLNQLAEICSSLLTPCNKKLT